MKNKDYKYQHLEFCTIIKYIGTDTIVEIPESIDGKKVDKLGGYCFANKNALIYYNEISCSQLITEVTIPGSIKYIEENAFLEQQLTKVTFNEGLEEIGAKAFYGCSKLESIVLPSTLKFIDYYAFACCDNLKSVTFLGKNVKLGNDVFMCNRSLDDIDFEVWKFLNFQELIQAFYYKFENFNTLTPEEQKQTISFVKKKPTLKKELLLSDNATVIQFLIDIKINVKLEDLIKYIEHHIEQNHTDITAILLEYKNKKYTKEEIDKFTENKELVEIGLELPTLKQLKQKWNVGKIAGGLRISGYKGSNTTETIPTGTVEGDLIFGLGISQTNDFKPIENLIIDAKIEILSKQVFSENYSLTTIKLPDTLKSIENYAFYDCSNLVDIVIPDGVEIIKTGAFKKCTSLENIVIPDSVNTLGDDIFSNCNNLKSIILPSSIKEIPSYALPGCENLEEIVIPDGVKVINNHGFLGCSNLKSVVLSENLEIISEDSFSMCSSLEKIVFPKSLKSIDKNAFAYCENLKIVEFNSQVEISKTAFKGCPDVKIIQK